MDIKYPDNLIDNDSGLNAYIKFTEFQRQVDLTPSGASNTICLYMPNDITNPTELNWKEDSLTKMGADLLSAGMKSKQDRLQNSSNEAQKTLDDAIARLGENSTAATNARNALANAKSPLDKQNKLMKNIGNIGKGLEDMSAQYIAKRIPNPYTVMIFESVSLRQFSFTFDFYPMSQNDTKTIQKIISMFHSGALPDDQMGIALGYPNEWEIEFMFNGEQNPYMPIFKRCVIESISTNYTNEGFWTMTRDGCPATIQLSLTFKENEIMVREDYSYSFNTTDNWLVNMSNDINNVGKEYGMNGVLSTLNVINNNVGEFALNGMKTIADLW